MQQKETLSGGFFNKENHFPNFLQKDIIQDLH